MRTLGSLLRHTRSARRLSQLELALRMNVSQRHVSFVEGDRARPSREMILNWMREVGASLSIRNAALLLAGYTPVLTETDPADARLAPARAALSRMLEAHEPLAGFVFDADWTMVELNGGGQWLCSMLMPEFWATLADTRGRGMDMIAGLTHPHGLLSRMREPCVAGTALLDQLRAEQWARPGLEPRADALEASLAERFGPHRGDDCRAPGEPYLNLVFDTGFGPLAFFTIQSVFALPQDVTLASMRIELWFPADDATRAVMTNRSGLATAPYD